MESILYVGIITKSVSRFARNVEDFLSSVRTLTEHNPPVGVYFQTEAIYSLQSDSSMALTVQATMAENESRNKSRSMETSLRMRLDHGLPLTPKLLGFEHDENGKLILNPETYRIPKLMFYMCLFGYSTQQIADKLTKLGKKTYLGNIKWTASGVVETLRNERYCGDVFTRKTFTRDVLSHKSVKNRGERPRSRYLDEHEAVVSRDDYMAVQLLLNNSKYKNKSILPELEVISDGLLKGYVIINPRWGSFTEKDYLRASAAAYENDEDEQEPEITVEAEEGDFDFSGYEIAQLDIIGGRNSPMLTLGSRVLCFGLECIRKMPNTPNIQLLIHPGKRMLAVRPAPAGDKHSVRWSRRNYGQFQPRIIPAAAFSETLFSLFDWDIHHKYRLQGTHLKNGNEEALFFTATNATVMIRKALLENSMEDDEFIPLAHRGQRVGAIFGDMGEAFGKNFYEEQTMAELIRQTSENWQIRLEGRLCSGGSRLNITPYEELKAFIQDELGELFWEDEMNEQPT